MWDRLAFGRAVIWPVVIYLIALAILLPFALGSGFTLTGDTSSEYALYFAIVETGVWDPPVDNLLASCLSTTLFPALIQRVTHVDPLLVFQLYCCFTIAFLPVTIYYLAKRYLPIAGALIAVGFGS